MRGMIGGVVAVCGSGHGVWQWSLSCTPPPATVVAQLRLRTQQTWWVFNTSNRQRESPIE